jgi:hypothetical protein
MAADQDGSINLNGLFLNSLPDMRLFDRMSASGSVISRKTGNIAH